MRFVILEAYVVFGFCDGATGSVLARDIKSLLAMWEPRIDNIIVKADPRPDQNEFVVNVLFDIIGQEFPAQRFSFILLAAR